MGEGRVGGPAAEAEAAFEKKRRRWLNPDGHCSVSSGSERSRGRSPRRPRSGGREKTKKKKKKRSRPRERNRKADRGSLRGRCWAKMDPLRFREASSSRDGQLQLLEYSESPRSTRGCGGALNFAARGPGSSSGLQLPPFVKPTVTIVVVVREIVVDANGRRCLVQLRVSRPELCYPMS